MKEQDAAHSFETWLEYGKLVMALSIDGAMLKVDDVSRHVFDKISEKYTVIQTAELTRLRSELQQKDEETTALKMKSEAQLQSYLYTTDTLTKKLQQERELRKELLPLAERMIVILGEHANEHYKELIKKAKLNN